MKVISIDDPRLLKLLLKDVRVETIYVGKQLLALTHTGEEHEKNCTVNCHICGSNPITNRRVGGT